MSRFSDFVQQVMRSDSSARAGAQSSAREALNAVDQAVLDRIVGATGDEGNAETNGWKNGNVWQDLVVTS